MLKLFLLFFPCVFTALLILVFPVSAREENNAKSDIIVVVNGENITEEAIQNRLKNVLDLSPETLETVRQEILDQLITSTLMEEFIDKKGLIVTFEEVESEIEKLRESIEGNTNSFQPLEKVLGEIGSTIHDFRRSIKHSIALDKYFKNKLDDKTLRKYFEANKSVFDDEAVKVSHILIDTRNMNTQAEFSMAREQIKKIEKEIEHGAAFDVLARQYSDCKSAAIGGDLGYIKRKDDLGTLFINTVFSLQVNQVSPPVRTAYGYHLIKITDKKEGSNIAFENVKDEVRLKALDEEIFKLLVQLRKEAHIKFKN
ncbi:MAG: peptidylprolyl isomerase [Candidatus Brocadiaceae bacterium]|nr:peptidylprolyl isomerase [Candidatus Brocadiaceae bacterium]